MPNSIRKNCHLLISVDVEPDQRNLKVDGSEPWKGQAYLNKRVEKIRQAFQKRTKRPANFVWCLRLDPQIEKSFGDAAWPLNEFDASIRSFERAGDRFGIHPHPFLWEDAAQSWRTEFGDQAWIEKCVRLSLDTYEAYFGNACRIFRFGDSWINGETLDLVARLGLAFDLTLEPGVTERKGWGAGDMLDQIKADGGGAPITPFLRLDTGDVSADGADHERLWMVPVSTATLRADTGEEQKKQPETDRRLSPRKLLMDAPQTLFEMTRLRSILKRYDCSRTLYERLAQSYIDLFSVPKSRSGIQTLNMALEPEYYASIFDQALLASGHRFMHTVLRSGDLAFRHQRANFASNIKFLLNHPVADAFVVSTPDRLSHDW